MRWFLMKKTGAREVCGMDRRDEGFELGVNGLYDNMIYMR